MPYAEIDEDKLQALGREMWAREDELVNHRLTWLGFAQTLLVTGYGYVIKEEFYIVEKLYDCANCSLDLNLCDRPEMVSGYRLFKYIVDRLPYVGLGTSVLILVGTLAATVAMGKIAKNYHHKKLGVSWPTTLAGWLCAVGIPFFFCLVWLLLLSAAGQMPDKYAIIVAGVLLAIVVFSWIGGVYMRQDANF